MKPGLSYDASGDAIERGARGHEQARSPYAIAQDGLSELLDAAVHAQRVEAMNAAVRVDVIFLTISYALRCEAAFVAPSLSPQRPHELARRAVTAELATALRMSERTMEHQIDEAWTLSTVLPATLGALREGLISARHASVIVEETTDLGDEPSLRAQLDERLAIVAASTTAATLRRRARALRQELQAETVAERHRAAREERRVELEPARDGMAWLHLFLPAPDALLIKDRLDQVARAAGTRAEDTDARGADQLLADARGVDQLRADAARDLLLHGRLPRDAEFAEAMALARPTVHVTVPVLTLLGASEEPGLLDGSGPIDADTARPLAAHAPSFTRLLTHPVSGTVLDVDRTSYRAPADLKRWLQVRDGTCRFPGCNRRASRCETDHSVDWADDGRTAFDNLAHLCPMHHHLKHETSWSVRHLPNGVLEWRSPAGRTHVTHPGQRIPSRADSTGPPGRETGTRRAPAAEPLMPAPTGGREYGESPPF